MGSIPIARSLLTQLALLVFLPETKRYEARFWTQLECAGVNRREVANARVVQVRRSEPTWPRVMRGQSQGCT